MTGWWPAVARSAVFAVFVLALVDLLAAAGDARAEEDTRSVFDAFGVDVDVTADTASEARAQALAEAERRAFEIVLARLTLPEDRAGARFGDAEIARLTRQFWVSEEKRSPVRYIATLNYSFRPDRVRQLLRSRGVPFVESPAPPVLVLPVFRADDGPVLWRWPNPWWEAWAARTEPSLVSMTLPLGDLDDAEVLSAEDALAGDAERLQALAGRYGVGQVLVAAARIEETTAGDTADEAAPPAGRVSVEARYWQSDGATETFTTEVEPANPEETMATTLNRATAATWGWVEDEWKRETLEKRERTTALPVEVRVDDLRSWRGIERRLADVSGVSRVEPVLLSADRVRVNVVHYRTPEELAADLERMRLYLYQDAAGGWVLDRSPPPPAPIVVPPVVVPSGPPPAPVPPGRFPPSPGAPSPSSGRS